MLGDAKKKKRVVVSGILILGMIAATIPVIIRKQRSTSPLRETAAYEVIDKALWHDGENVISLELRKNKETEKSIWYQDGSLMKESECSNNSPVLEFSIDEVKASNALTKQSEYITDDTGELYRGELSLAEEYLRYLSESGKAIVYERFSAVYYEAYLKEGETLYRFIYFVKTNDSGVVLYSQMLQGEEVPSVESVIGI